MAQATVHCGCGRTMTPAGSLGKGYYRCGCDTIVRLQLDEQALAARCVYRVKAGRQCAGRPMHGTQLCGDHLQEVFRLVVDEPDHFPARALDFTAALTRLRTTEAELEGEGRRRWLAKQAELDKRPHVVYYLRLGNGDIKIGYTSNLPERMRALRARPGDLLAVEPGAREKEKERHQQFASLRRESWWEDFEPAPELLRHIEAVRAEHGDPADWPPRATR